MKEVRVPAHTIYLVVGPKADDARDMFKPLLSGSIRLTKRSWVICVAIVLVQALRDKGQVLIFESLAPFKHELDLRGIGIFPVGHWNEGVGDRSSVRTKRQVGLPSLYIRFRPLSSARGRSIITIN